MPSRLSFLLLCLAPVVFLSGCFDQEPRRIARDDGSIQAFVEIPIKGDHENLWAQIHHPFVGATPIDVDGDGHLEIFLGGGTNHPDRLFFYQNGRLVNQIEGRGLSSLEATHGANSIDFDGDGDTDLVLARSNGIFWYQNEGGHFIEHHILSSPAKTAPLSLALGDIDRDGDLDIYVSMFVDFANFASVTFNDPSHAKKNVMLRNEGNGRFIDVTDSSGTAGLQNSFLASFTDLNNDQWPDLIVSQNTGQIEIFRNLGTGRFEPVALETGWGFWMSLALGDVDKDGDLDLFSSNSGISIPRFFLELLGDGLDSQPRNYDWILLRNEGNFKFTNVAKAYRIDGYGFGWGGVFEDLTLDGQLELLVAQNYIKWPLHESFPLPGKVLIQQKGAFYHQRALGLENPNFAQAPLILDINRDGRPDVFWVNMQGFNRAFLNDSSNHFLTLVFPDEGASLGAQAILTMADGQKSYLREVHNSMGMSTDQWTGLTFGLGDQSEVSQVMIKWPDGQSQILTNPQVDQAILITR